MTLNQILDLVGTLDDSAGPDTPRERFRRFLTKNVLNVAEVRDHIEQCLRTPGDQYNRALQDLVNHLGGFLGFDVVFGRYRGVQGEIGYDGHWKSPSGLHVVLEVKTTETYAVKTSTLIGYVDELISHKRIPSWDSALGLYVVGRPDPEVRQLEHAIVAEKRTSQLRIISAESLLSVGDLVSDYGLSHDDVLAILKPSGPTVDALAGLIARLVAQAEVTEPPKEVEPPAAVTQPEAPTYWLTPVKDYEGETAEECIKSLVGEHQMYAFGEATPGRKRLKVADRICFYATGRGIVADAEVASPPERKPDRRVRHSTEFPFTFRLRNCKLYPEKPVVLDAALRMQLGAFKNRDSSSPWAWFVQATHRITESDFKLLTRR
jgi:hypothetical protein